MLMVFVRRVSGNHKDILYRKQCQGHMLDFGLSREEFDRASTRTAQCVKGLADDQ